MKNYCMRLVVRYKNQNAQTIHVKANSEREREQYYADLLKADNLKIIKRIDYHYSLKNKVLNR